MSKSKSRAMFLMLAVMITGLSATSLLQPPQTSHSQQDYEEYLIVETDTAQELKQKNAGSGESTNINCGTNAVGSNLVACPVETPTSGAVIPVVTQREGNVVNLAITGVTSTATCNSDEVVVGGGYRATDNFNIRSEEKVGNSWQINVIGSAAPGSTFQALAECLKLVPA